MWFWIRNNEYQHVKAILAARFCAYFLPPLLSLLLCLLFLLSFSLLCINNLSSSIALWTVVRKEESFLWVRLLPWQRVSSPSWNKVKRVKLWSFIWDVLWVNQLELVSFLLGLWVNLGRQWKAMPIEALLFMISEEPRDCWVKEFMASLYYYNRRPSEALMLDYHL